jgi:hypothetical protein
MAHARTRLSVKFEPQLYTTTEPVASWTLPCRYNYSDPSECASAEAISGYSEAAERLSTKINLLQADWELHKKWTGTRAYFKHRLLQAGHRRQHKSPLVPTHGKKTTNLCFHFFDRSMVYKHCE